MNCNNGKNCPYLDGANILTLLKEREYSRERIADMERAMELAEAKIRGQEEEIKRLKEENNSLTFRIKKMTERIFKPNVKKERDGESPRRGAPERHFGSGRVRPVTISEWVDIYPEQCDCGNTDILRYENSFDTHVEEDIEVRKKVTCYRMHYGYCRRCKKTVSPKRKIAIKNSRIGPMARAIGGYLHYLGIPYRKVAKIFKDVFDLEITHVSIMGFDTRQAENGVILYKGIKEVVRNSSYINADETGWRVDGGSCWLWVFITSNAVLYVIDESRGSKVVIEVMGDKYGGILGSDFYSGYNPIEAKGKQKCLTHLLREIKDIEKKNKFLLESADGRFCSELKEVVKDTIACFNEYKEENKGLEELKEDKDRIIGRMVEIIQIPVEHSDTHRIRERVIKHNNELFTCLDNPIIEPTNNISERQLRPNVIMRKITFGNRSEKGKKKHEIIMSIIQTGIVNKVEPLRLFLALTKGERPSFEEMVRIRGP